MTAIDPGAWIRRTPVVEIPAVTARIGRVLLKLEHLQRTGSFKVRGAARKLSRLSAQEQEAGIVAASAGNHGAGVAFSAAHMGLVPTVFVPETTPQVKRAHIAGYGAKVVVRGAHYDDAEAEARAHAAQTGAVFVSPFDDDDIIAGNGGSLADELISQVADLAQVVCPVGGGGLISGLAMRLAPRGVAVIGVQPEANCAMYESLQLGRALTQYTGRPTLAEGCEGAVAERTFAITAAQAGRIELVSEDAICRAVGFAYRQAGAIIECSAACALAAFLEGCVTVAPQGTTVCLLTGGNIEPDLLDQILRETA